MKDSTFKEPRRIDGRWIVIEVIGKGDFQSHIFVDKETALSFYSTFQKKRT